MARKTATKRHRKGSMKRVKGGMTTGEHGSAVYGNTNQQMAIGNGSNVIRMNDPNAVALTNGSVQGGRKLKRGRKHGGGFFDGILGSNSDAEPIASEPIAAEPIAEPISEPVAEEEEDEIYGGKKKRKSAKKHRKSSKKGKTAKRRAQKRR
jgi:hypothetical protein